MQTTHYDFEKNRIVPYTIKNFSKKLDLMQINYEVDCEISHLLNTTNQCDITIKGLHISKEEYTIITIIASDINGTESMSIDFIRANVNIKNYKTKKQIKHLIRQIIN